MWWTFFFFLTDEHLEVFQQDMDAENCKLLSTEVYAQQKWLLQLQSFYVCQHGLLVTRLTTRGYCAYDITNSYCNRIVLSFFLVNHPQTTHTTTSSTTTTSPPEIKGPPDSPHNEETKKSQQYKLEDKHKSILEKRRWTWYYDRKKGVPNAGKQW